MNKFSKFIKYMLKLPVYLLFYLLYLISYFFPRNNKIWLFGSHNNTFSDNSKYFFWYVADNHKNEIRPIWISKNKNVVNMLREKGYEAYYKWSVKGWFYSLRGKVYIYSAYTADINFWTSGGAIKVNLWHGVPLKRIEFDIKVGSLRKKYNSKWKYLYMLFFPYCYQKPSYLLSTSRTISEIFSSAFRIPVERCLEFGYPRCEHFNWSEDKILEFVRQKEPETFNFIEEILKKYNRVYIYMPTFRDKLEKNDVSKKINLEELNELLKSKNWLFLIKQHPNINLHLNLTFSNIIYLPTKMDAYMLLPFTHVLITDYSSVMFDYLLLKKTIILFQDDYEDYKNYERGFYFAPEELGIGLRITSYQALKMLLIDTSQEDKLKNKVYIDKFWTNELSPNERLFQFLKKY